MSCSGRNARCIESDDLIGSRHAILVAINKREDVPAFGLSPLAIGALVPDLLISHVSQLIDRAPDRLESIQAITAGKHQILAIRSGIALDDSVIEGGVVNNFNDRINVEPIQLPIRSRIVSICIHATGVLTQVAILVNKHSMQLANP